MRDALTPMMQQYRRLRGSIPPDTLLLFRLGDFYELFFEDAKEASGLLNVALTKRNGVPMCGVPYHAAQTYIAKLIRAGRRVAICDQTSEPQPCFARYHSDRQLRHGKRSGSARGEACKLCRRHLCRFRHFWLCLRGPQHRRVPNHSVGESTIVARPACARFASRIIDQLGTERADRRIRSRT
ncbi:MAG: hypothetical protein DME80_12985 [Verrucomicrobia bacterium]|nr:MAG: hypothetical protein DME80_12985 [Verrucomicrobiota bacterium]